MKQQINIDEVKELIEFCADNEIQPSAIMALMAKFLADMGVDNGRFGAIDDNDVMHIYEFQEVRTYPVEIKEKESAEVINFRKESKGTTKPKGSRTKRNTLLH